MRTREEARHLYQDSMRYLQGKIGRPGQKALVEALAKGANQEDAEEYAMDAEDAAVDEAQRAAAAAAEQTIIQAGMDAVVRKHTPKNPDPRRR